jgi:hypothetical protein
LQRDVHGHLCLSVLETLFACQKCSISAMLSKEIWNAISSLVAEHVEANSANVRKGFTQ